MISDNIKRLFDEPDPISFVVSARICELEIEMAAAVFFTAMAYSDRHISTAELVVILRAVSGRFALTDREIGELLEIIDPQTMPQEKVERFCEVARQTLTDKTKEDLLFVAWKVALADGSLDPREIEYAKYLKTKLGINDLQFRKAIKRAEQSILAAQDARRKSRAA